MPEPNKEIRGIYEELKGILVSLSDIGSWFDDKGFIEQVNNTINRVTEVCPEIQDIDSYILKADYSPNRGPTVDVTQAKSKLGALIGRIKGTYDLDSYQPSSGHTIIQNQTQSQSLNIILDLQEKILSEIPKYSKESKEGSFLEKFKNTLPTIKNITDIFSSALKIGGELGLDPETIRKLLGF